MGRAIPISVKAKKTWRSVVYNWQLYVMIAPILILIFIFSYIPMAGAQIAFRDYNPIQGIWGSPWVGLDNFEWFFSMPDSWRLIRNTLAMSGLGIALGFSAPIILALMINEIPSERYKKFVQTVTYAPYFIYMPAELFLGWASSQDIYTTEGYERRLYLATQEYEKFRPEKIPPTGMYMTSEDSATYACLVVPYSKISIHSVAGRMKRSMFQTRLDGHDISVA